MLTTDDSICEVQVVLIVIFFLWNAVGFAIPFFAFEKNESLQSRGLQPMNLSQRAMLLFFAGPFGWIAVAGWIILRLTQQPICAAAKYLWSFFGRIDDQDVLDAIDDF